MDQRKLGNTESQNDNGEIQRIREEIENENRTM